MGAAGLIRVIDFKCCMTAPLMLENMCGGGTQRPACRAVIDQSDRSAARCPRRMSHGGIHCKEGTDV